MEEIWNLSALCRCCHRDGQFMDLKTLVSDTKSYLTMLEDTLSISMDIPLFEASSSICDLCIEELTRAHVFKEKVLQCEMKFKEYCQNELSTTCDLKLEVESEIETDDSFNEQIPDFDDQSIEDTKDDILPKEENNEELNQKRATTSKEATTFEMQLASLTQTIPLTRRLPYEHLNPEFHKYVVDIENERKCTLCDHVYTIHDYKTHLRNRHRIEIIGSCKCVTCGTILKNDQAYRYHRKLVHNEYVDLNIECKICNTFHKTIGAFRDHNRKKHTPKTIGRPRKIKRGRPVGDKRTKSKGRQWKGGEFVRRCINCSLRLPRQLQWQSVGELNENTYNILTDWISPTPISRDNVVCMECFSCLQSAIKSGPAPAPVFGHRSVCFSCGTSILRERTSRVPLSSEERNIIRSWISPHLFPRLERVCRACWMAAKRHVQKHLQQDANRTVHAEDENVAIRELTIPEPPPLSQVDLFLPQKQQEPKIMSRTYKRAAATTRHSAQNSNGDILSIEKTNEESNQEKATTSKEVTKPKIRSSTIIPLTREQPLKLLHPEIQKYLIDIKNKRICTLCKRVYKLHNYKTHLKAVHEITITYNCDLCNAVLDRDRSYRQHRRLVHNEDLHLKIECDICKKTLKNVQSYKKHKLNHSLTKLPKKKIKVKCKICKQTYKSLKTLRHHQLKHSEIIFTCKHCCKQYINYNKLIWHSVIHVGKSCICDHCKKVFPEKEKLRSHIYRHLGFKKCYRVKDKTCKYCKIQFMTLKECRTHVCKGRAKTFIKLESPEDTNIDNKNPEDESKNIKIKKEKLNVKKCGKCKQNCVWKAEDTERHVKEIFNCKTCKFRTRNYDLLITHFFNNHTENKKSYYCHFCSKKFARKTTLSDHLLLYHYGKSLKKFICEQCGSSFRCKATLNIHIRCVHENRREFACELCPKTYTSKKHLKQHLRRHTGENNIKCDKLNVKKCGKCKQNCVCKAEDTERPVKEIFNCKTCKFKTRNYDLLIRHFLYNHTENKHAHYCHYCSKKFASKTSLSNHLLLYHYGKSLKKFICEQCGSSFRCKATLNIHIRCVHENRRDFACELCPNTYKSKKHLKQHLRRHTGEKNIKCDQCDEAFYELEKLNCHKKTRHITETKATYTRTNLNCKICKDVFATRAEFTQHYLIHKDKLVHRCTYCNKRFAGKYSLNRHIGTHLGQTYPCDLCGKHFTDKNIMKRHKRTLHFGEPSSKCSNLKTCLECNRNYTDYEKHKKFHDNLIFKCPICNKSYSSKGVLNRHMASIHATSKLYRCRPCKKRFLRKNGFIKHNLKFHNMQTELSDSDDSDSNNVERSTSQNADIKIDEPEVPVVCVVNCKGECNNVLTQPSNEVEVHLKT